MKFIILISNLRKHFIIATMYKLSDKVDILPGIGPKTAQNLNTAGFNTIEDLVWHVPYRYEDQS